MKAFKPAWMAAILAIHSAQAQTASSANVPADTTYAIIGQGANENVWEKTTYEQAPDGTVHAKSHRYLELASGLNYWNNGQWTPGQEQIEPFSGGAVAQKGQYQVIFANNLNSQGAIDCRTADGKRLRSNILSLEYYDPVTGQSAMIGQVQDSQGELVSANQVLYPNAFTGVSADVRYTYNKSGFEQEVILRAQLPAPETFGLSSTSCELAVCTEFINPPAADVRNVESGEQLSNGLESDHGISWGATTLSRGHAFDMGDHGQVPVTKQYMTIQGRQILVEKVRLNKIQGYLSKLPEQAGLNRRSPLIASRTLIVPSTPLAQKAGKPLKYAKESTDKGFVMDYISLSTSFTNYIFQGDTTYYVSGNVNLCGTNYFEGGTVIKYASGASITEVASPLTPQVVFESTPYLPVVFTAKDDNTCGQPISGSTGSPSGYYATPALYLPSGGLQSFADFKIAYANPAINAPSTSLTLYDGQFYKCGAGVALSGDPGLVENVLFSSVQTNFVLGAGAVVSAQQVTFDNSISLTSPAYSLPTGASLALTNCVLVDVTNLPGIVAAAYNGFYQTTEIGSSYTTNSVNPFQSALGGGCYLANSCAFHNAGSLNINSNLWIDLASKTTHAPIVYSNATFSAQTNFGPQAQRDTNSLPDLGYHYAPLDYIFGGVNAYANLTFSDGTVVGWYNGGPGASTNAGYGIALNGSAQATFSGTATTPCVLAKNTMVQEGDTGYWTPEGYLGGFTGLGGNNTEATAPTLNLDFTHLYARGVETAFFRDFGDGTLLVTKANNSEFYSGEAAGYAMDLLFTNCLSFRSILGVNCACSSLVTMRNCTFFGGQLAADRESGATWPLMIEDCAFAAANFTNINDPSGGSTNITWFNFNSYLTTDSLPAGQGTNYLTITNYNWQNSWFGNYYLPSNSPLIQAGSTTANLIGLYHFTTQTNQTQETNSVVDIGYHYVATDAYGNPIDSNGDGSPDYWEDANGNGLDDTGEIPWDVSILTQPASLTVVPGATATFSVTAGGNLPLAYQWRFNGTNLTGATSATFAVTNAASTNAGNYSITITSTTGHSLTSSNALLTLLAPPVITAQPTNQTVNAGSNVIFSVTASGGTLSYQWWFNGTNLLAGQTSSVLLLTNVWSPNAGNYFVIVSNLDGSVTSSNALLTVNIPPTCDPPPSSLVSWWQGNGNASDTLGANNGTWVGTAAYASGEVGQAFSVSTNNYISVPDSASLDQFTTNITIEFWTKGSGPTNNWFSLVCKTDSGYEIRLTDHTNTADLVINGLTPGNLVGNRNIHDGNWHHIAGVYDGTNMYLYVDGTLDTQQANTGIINCAVGTALDIGTAANFTSARAYVGLIDEVSIYNKALSSNQIAAIYNAGSAGKCTTSQPVIVIQPANQTTFQGGSATFNVTATGGSLNYQWWFNGTNLLSGQTNSTLVLTSVQFAQAGNYDVVINNTAGSVTSSNALLTVNSVPSCDPPPSSLVSWWQGNGNASDTLGANNGTWVGTAAYASGEVGQAFSVSTNNYISVPDSASLDQFTTNITIEFWTKGSGPTNNWFSLVCKTDSGYEIRLTDHTNTADLVINGLTPGNLVGNRNIHDGNWHHIAGVYDGTNMYLYVDGTLDTQQANSGTINCAVGTALDIGTAANFTSARAYVGLIDEVSIYNKALSSNQIAAIYNAGAGGKCPPSPPVITSNPFNQEVAVGSTASFSVTATGWSPLSYQWTFNGTNLAGATNPTLTLTNVQLTQAGSYNVVVANLVGSAMSANALLYIDSALGYWRFDVTNILATNAWVGDQGQLPLVATNVVGVPSWDTNAVLIDSTNSAILNYRTVETNGSVNLSPSFGAVSFWFRPDWTSSNSFGTGPGANGRLIEIGNYNPLLNTNLNVSYFTNGWWSLYLSPDGNQIVFGSSTNGGFQINLDAVTTFTSNQWCQIVLTYTATNSLLYLNAQLLTNGLGAIYYPNQAEQAAGFRIGSDSSGNNQARGVFEDLATYSYPLDPGTISNIFQADISLDSGGDGLSNILANELGLNPYVYNSLYGLSGTNGLQVFTPLR